MLPCVLLVVVIVLFLAWTVFWEKIGIYFFRRSYGRIEFRIDCLFGAGIDFGIQEIFWDEVPRRLQRDTLIITRRVSDLGQVEWGSDLVIKFESVEGVSGEISEVSLFIYRQMPGSSELAAPELVSTYDLSKANSSDRITLDLYKLLGAQHDRSLAS